VKGNNDMTAENDNEKGVSPQRSINTGLWTVLMALALLRPCSTIYHFLGGLAWGTPARCVFDVWENLVWGAFLHLHHSWEFQYACPFPVWAFGVAGAYWYIKRRLYQRKALTIALLGIVALMNVFMIRVEVRFIEPGSPEDLAIKQQRAEELARKCISEDPATEAWAMAMAQGKAKCLDCPTAASITCGDRDERTDSQLIGVIQEDGSIVTNTYVSLYEVKEKGVVVTNFTSRAEDTVSELIFLTDSDRKIKDQLPSDKRSDPAEPL
jgi:hypothetical protein